MEAVSSTVVQLGLEEIMDKFIEFWKRVSYWYRNNPFADACVLFLIGFVFGVGRFYFPPKSWQHELMFEFFIGLVLMAFCLAGYRALRKRRRF